MTAAVFSRKLDALPATVDLFRTFDAGALASALANGAGRHALSIGSGGSAIGAEYLARCRDTLGLGPTTVQTPMQIVLDQQDLHGSDVWLFSAGADNPDVIAASRAALDRRATALHVVTRNPIGGAVEIAARGGGSIHIVPVADKQDGYLATHSLISSITALLLASDIASREPQGAEFLLDNVIASVIAMLDPHVRASRAVSLAGLSRHDTVVIVSDPLLRPTAVLLDTSIWEAALCPVQTTDFRNFAHGRHAWLHHRVGETVIVALTGQDSRSAWAAIDNVVPSECRRLRLEYDYCGRLENLKALVGGLGLVEAMGTVLEIDPGKPGIGAFGRSVYDDTSLVDLAGTMPAHLRHKRAAIARSDVYQSGGSPLHVIGRKRFAELAEARIGGAVFDYDGTIVTTAGRFSPPDGIILDEFVRLHDAGLKIGIATGRGGSAGEVLRKVLPAKLLPSILIGYYNGGHLRTADVDIGVDAPIPDPLITEAADWLNGRHDLFLDHKFKVSGVQITVEMDRLRNPYRFALDLAECPVFADGRVRVMGSGHSYDLVPATSSKLAVVRAIKGLVPQDAEVLCFGDSGSRSGNDHALLSHRFAISVGDVCNSPDGCWSLFGSGPTGPEALLKVLRALKPAEAGMLRLDVGSLGLETG
jgi:fructoselysine-6-P-deglycase FrlB-like protein